MDDEKAFRTAESELLTTLPEASDGLISRYVNRPLSGKITRHLLKTAVTPNHASVASFFVAMLGALLFFLGGFANRVAGATLAQLSSVLNGCDGAIARLKYQALSFGGRLDAVLDRYADAFLLFGLTYHVYVPQKAFLNLIFRLHGNNRVFCEQLYSRQV